ncbi:MAG TPA: class I SAM-dependent methyltransferase, partial [Chitinophagaceae bacterium]|nr:class I SAM-dependent methyltransferase [Chitinophagaceae bacterium]
AAIEAKAGISHYGVRILLEAGIGIGLLYEEEGRYFITKTGSLFITDAMVRVNTNFMRDICYEGAAKLKESIEENRPAGLPFLGPWKTIYEGLTQLNPQQSKSWFEFDHYYSDFVFPLVMPMVFEQGVKKVMDIGANTGKFSLQCLNYNPDVHMYLVDLGKQLDVSRKNLDEAGFQGRYTLMEHDMLDAKTHIDGQYDVIWMSQFLDCFSDAEILQILEKCKKALAPEGRIIINETFWDKQPFHAAMYALQMTSLYFTTMANGNSQMYDSRVFDQLIEQAGLQVLHREDNLAHTHSIRILGR